MILWSKENFEPVGVAQSFEFECEHFSMSFEEVLILLCKMVLTIESVDELIHNYASLKVVLSCGSVYYAIQGGSNF